MYTSCLLNEVWWRSSPSKSFSFQMTVRFADSMVFCLNFIFGKELFKTIKRNFARVSCSKHWMLLCLQIWCHGILWFNAPLSKTIFTWCGIEVISGLVLDYRESASIDYCATLSKSSILIVAKTAYGQYMLPLTFCGATASKLRGRWPMLLLKVVGGWMGPLVTKLASWGLLDIGWAGVG